MKITYWNLNTFIEKEISEADARKRINSSYKDNVNTWKKLLRGSNVYVRGGQLTCHSREAKAWRNKMQAMIDFDFKS